ncbi:SDR family NAD(P)-dependent oxidoreductase [Nocardia terpenica]|uniref:type I polyketide synthase n=1 Tax=Nocardia terpenica TaxID=455432 RepID=UPI002FDF318F
MSVQRIAVVGMACRYPDAESPGQLWENVLAGRRAFRRLPDERMRAEDYYSPDPSAPDRFYSSKAAVIDGWEFDRVKYRIAGSTYRSTDLVHWLALDTTARALEDAGFPGGAGLPRESTGVIIGNTLTGEFSRANVLRLRWPYVRRTVGAALREQGWDDARLTAFLDSLEARYKQPFPPIDEDTLAGGLANTISGRICNYFDFKGGGYTVDGACSSSLLSTATGCNALVSGQLEVAVVGGVDLSIDPFEVIGFAKTGALSTSEMKVYDRNSNGFWPGEGCGVLVLMRDEDAVRRGLHRYATIAGWGYSSDGKGGITRPEADGHRLALQRAYAAAGFGIDTVGYLEGHGTGTAVGDATELRAFGGARRAAGSDRAAPIGTIKGNIGHTKAAAGVAGLIKAIQAVRHQIVPPTTGTVDPHPELTGADPALRVPVTAELWPADLPVRAGVSSMGFGGINAHVVVEHADGVRPVELDETAARLARSRQDRELLLLDADDTAELCGKVTRLVGLSAKLSYAELADLAATLHGELAGRRIRAAVVTGAPEDAERKFTRLLSLLDNGIRSVIDADGGLFLGDATGDPRIGFLFPGQGAGRRGDGGALRYRFPRVDELYRTHRQATDGDLVATAVAQPRIVTSSLAGLRVLTDLGIEASAAVGHSLGELTALHWAGAMDEEAVLDVAAARGAIMAQASEGGGTMAGIAAAPEVVRPLLDGERVVIAGYNSPRQTVVSGPVDAVERVCARAAVLNLATMRISVSHAFHSELVAPAATALREYLGRHEFRPLARRMVSTVTADTLPPEVDVPALLARQVLDPVRFTEAVAAMAEQTDLLLEVGPGRVLGRLAGEIAPAVPVISMETDGLSLSGLLHAVAAAYVLGAPVRTGALYRERFTRPLPLDKQFRFFASPAESAPTDDLGAQPTVPDAVPNAESGAPQGRSGSAASSIDVLRRLAAERAELPLDAVRPDSQLLDELHLSSITVGQIVNQASTELGLAPPVATSTYATATLTELADMLNQLGDTAIGADAHRPDAAQGVAPWVRAFAVDLVPAETPTTTASPADGEWRLFATEDHPVAAALLDGLRAARLGSGVLLCLPHDADDKHVPLMLAAVRAALDIDGAARFVVVGDRRGAAGLAKTLHLETPRIDTTVLTLPLAADPVAPDLIAALVADVAATNGFREVHYDRAGHRRVPILRPLTLPAAAGSPLTAQDVLLVTGGGKGITAECALALALDSGASIGLLGRSDPKTDRELAANLARMAAAGVEHRYVRADVTAPEQVEAAVDDIRRTLGPVTAVLHGAGRNEPRALADLDEDSFRRTLAPKITGLETVLAATDPATLRLLVTFGSIIGRAGLRGEADYATANDWLTELTRRVGADHPNCRCLALEWSVWSGAGMGERLGVLESLIREGISPIPVEDGIDIVRRILADPRAPASMVVMGRAEGLPTVAFERSDLPLLRFLDRPQVHYPGVELVVDTELSAGGDLYLTDHLLDGDLLFPAVFGMEAMAQAAVALTGDRGAPVLEDLRFLRPIVVPVGGATTIRVAALVTGPDTVEAVIRSSDTGFQADHFRATLRFPGEIPAASRDRSGTSGLLPVDPGRDLYGPVLFQGKRFQRLIGYRQLAATDCVAEIANVPVEPWFAAFLSADLVLGDPGTRDCVMHSIQCCVPDATLLPTAVERLYPADPGASKGWESVTTHAVERFRDGDTYVYDVDVRDPSGRTVERWQGLRLQAVRKQDGGGPWLPVLLGPYLERRTGDVLPTALRCVVWPDRKGRGNGAGTRRERTALAADFALGGRSGLRYRPDGKPELDGAAMISASHGAGMTFLVVSARGGAVGCDVEVAARRSAAEWEKLLGPDQFALARLVAREHDEDLTVAATRVWGAVECLRKNGRARIEPVTADGPAPGRWVLLRSGTTRIATFPTTVHDLAEPVVFTLLTAPATSVPGPTDD